MTCVGLLALRRHWWGNRCPCAVAAGYQVDACLGLDSYLNNDVKANAQRAGRMREKAQLADNVRGYLRATQQLRPSSGGTSKPSMFGMPREALEPSPFIRSG